MINTFLTGSRTVRRGRFSLTAVFLLGCIVFSEASAEIITPAPSDDTIREKIFQKVTGQVGLHLQQFEVEVNQGVARIRGTVASLSELQKLERLAGSAQGVRGLESLVQVRPADRPEPVIEDEVRRRLERRPQYKNSPVTVSASGTVVTLSGTVSRNFDRLEAAAIAGEIEGVTRIINDLVAATAGPVDDDTIRRRVESILVNPLTFGAVRDLRVTVTGARVSLKGSVIREFDRREAERLALTVDGVESVQNELTIRPE